MNLLKATMFLFGTLLHHSTASLLPGEISNEVKEEVRKLLLHKPDNPRRKKGGRTPHYLFPSLEQDSSDVNDFENPDELLDVITATGTKDEDEARFRRTAVFDKKAKENKTSSKNIYDVIIVGAGWSGIGAAVKLQAEGITNFKVLEGRDYIGGRSYTKQVDGYDIDMGSHWLLYGPQNPLWNLATQTETVMAAYNYNFDFMSETGNVGVKKYEELYDQTYGAFDYYRYIKSLVVDYYEEGLDESANETISLIQDNVYYDNDLKVDTLKVYLQEYLELAYGAKMEDLSLWYGMVGEESYLGGYYHPDNDDYLVYSGFTPMVEALAEPINDKIQTESKVTSINYKNKSVKVRYEDRSGNEMIEKNLYAKKVIVTVPLGVLKKNQLDGGIAFRPLLPDKKRNAIDRIGVGNMIKAFLFWNEEDIFWPGEFDDAEMYADVEETVGTDFRITFYNPSYNQTEKLPFLFTFMINDELFEIAELYADSNEAKYEEEVTKAVMKPLRNIFGESVPDPEKIVVSKWTSDEFSYGVYSYNKVGYMAKDRKRLRNSVGDKIFFGGEATSTKFYSTVHGAYWSGVAAANEVLKK